MLQLLVIIFSSPQQAQVRGVALDESRESAKRAV
jgi:hypothetical protein